MQNPDLIFGRLGNRLFQLSYIYAQMRRGEIDDIYVQDPKYFEDYKDDLRQIFNSQYPAKIDQVAIHVRRGDYVDNPFYVDLMETPYYRDAMAQFQGAEFLVFSDDIPWCKKQEIFKYCEFSEGNNELEDLTLMSGCTGHIIANSSFSWWGAWLSPYTKKVIAPKLWYGDGNQDITKLPSSWIRI